MANGWILRFNECRTTFERLPFTGTSSCLAHKINILGSQTYEIWSSFGTMIKIWMKFLFFRSEAHVRLAGVTITSFKTVFPLISRDCFLRRRKIFFLRKKHWRRFRRITSSWKLKSSHPEMCLEEETGGRVDWKINHCLPYFLFCCTSLLKLYLSSHIPDFLSFRVDKERSVPPPLTTN